TLLLFPKSGNPEAHGLAGLQVDRVWLLAHADTGRRAGGNDVAPLQAHEVAEVGYQLLHVEDHGLGAAVLIAVAVDLQPHREVLRIGNLVPGHQPRTGGAEGVAALALVPLAAALDLELALR